MSSNNKVLAVRQLHKIVWIFVGVFVLTAITFPLAFIRVAQTEKFAGFHVKSLPVGKLPENEPKLAAQNLLTAKEKTPANNTVIQSAHQQTNVSNPPLLSSINDQQKVMTLRDSLYEKIDQNWQTVPTFGKNLIYQAKVDIAGQLTAVQAMNKEAKEYMNELPWSNLLENSSIPQPTANFLVVFTPSGLLEVSIAHDTH